MGKGGFEARLNGATVGNGGERAGDEGGGG